MGEVQETFPLGLQHLACSTSSTSISSLIPHVCVCFTFLLQMPETAKVNNDFTCAFSFGITLKEEGFSTRAKEKGEVQSTDPGSAGPYSKTRSIANPGPSQEGS